MFLGTAFEVEEPLPNVEQRYKCTEKKEMWDSYDELSK